MDWSTIGYTVTDTGHYGSNLGSNIIHTSGGSYCSESGSFSDSLPTSGPEVVTIDMTNPVIFSQFELRIPWDDGTHSPQDWSLEGQLRNGNWQVLYDVKGFKFPPNKTVVFGVIKSSGKLQHHDNLRNLEFY